MSQNGDTALHLATVKKEIEIAKLLLNAGAHINMEDKGGNTARHLASTKGLVDSFQLLVEACMQVNRPNAIQTTPLHYAAQAGSFNIIKKLSIMAIRLLFTATVGLLFVNWQAYCS